MKVCVQWSLRPVVGGGGGGGGGMRQARTMPDDAIFCPFPQYFSHNKTMRGQ